MTHDVNEPLQATYNIQRPRWVGWYTGREYKGRANWWSELGYTDSITPHKKIVPVRHPIRENDPDWWDPKVPDGESLPGAFGKDTRFYGNTTFKGDQVGDVFDFKKKVMQSSAQYKQIAEKYDISPEHPGIDVNPTMSALQHHPWANLGVGSIFPTMRLVQFGPRFFDKPMNEGCFEKGLALTKYAAMFNVLYTYAIFQSEPSKDLKHFVIRDYVRRYFRHLPFPAAISFTYGVSICTAATIRNKDDVRNPFYAAVCSGIVTATIKSNIALGITFGMMLTVFGTFWHYQRVSRLGLQGPVMNQMFSGYWAGPQLYKMTDLGHAEVPDDVY